VNSHRSEDLKYTLKVFDLETNDKTIKCQMWLSKNKLPK